MLIHDRFVFIHVPKTAGSFLAQALMRELPEGTLRKGPSGRQHPGWNQIPEDARDRPVLGYVRNPWDWYVSWYFFYMKAMPDTPRFRLLFDNGRNDFATAVRNGCSGLAGTVSPAAVQADGGGDDFYTRRIRASLGGGLGSERLTVGRYESLVDDFERFLADVEVSLSRQAMARIRTGEPLNVTEHGPYRDYYDAELRDLVGISCRALIDRFGYDF